MMAKLILFVKITIILSIPLTIWILTILAVLNNYK